MTAAPRVTQLLSKASRALNRRGDAVLAPTGLRFAHVPVIVLLRSSGGMTQKALAEAVGVEQPSMAQLLARMERDGLVRRAAHPTDARSRINTLAPGQEPAVNDARQRLDQLEKQALRTLRVDEVHTLVDLLSRVIDNLQE
jgi:MarR family transcriptional regulator for hemolysin